MEPRDKKPKKDLTNEVEVTRFKGSGPGGQNRNKRETGIRVKHLQTGVIASATERRSQGQNLSAAFERLQNKLDALAYRPPPRKKRKPSAAAGRRRLDAKKKASQKKSNRNRRFSDD